jgi:small basic protein (TIGR04137 family)
MTQHRSLRGKKGTREQRTVLKRRERIKLLQERGKREKESSIYGLPKVKP